MSSPNAIYVYRLWTSKTSGFYTYTNAAVESITTIDVWSLNAVVKKHPNVSAANTVSVNANMVLALAKKVFILAYISIVIKSKHQHAKYHFRKCIVSLRRAY